MPQSDLDKAPEEKLYWLIITNQNTMEDVGYLLNAAQLRDAVGISDIELHRLDTKKGGMAISSGERVIETRDPAMSYESKWMVYRLETLEEVKESMEWRGWSIFDTTRAVTFGQNQLDYPEFLNDYIDVYGYPHEYCPDINSRNGRTAMLIPRDDIPQMRQGHYSDGFVNPTFDKYFNLLHPERLSIRVSDEDRVSSEITKHLLDKTLTYQTYKDIVERYPLFDIVGEFKKKYAPDAPYDLPCLKDRLYEDDIKKIYDFACIQKGFELISTEARLHDTDIDRLLKDSPYPLTALCKGATAYVEDTVHGERDAWDYLNSLEVLQWCSEKDNTPEYEEVDR